MNTPEMIIDKSARLYLCGGPYSNFSSLEAFLKESAKADYRFCLGDIGGFGPHPDRSIELLRNNQVYCIQGNYDQTVGEGEADCGCGYIDPIDRKFAQVSFDYTLKNTSDANRAWLRSLPKHLKLKWGDKKILLCHGSPDEVNEFVFESETSEEKIDQWLKKYNVDAICVTHSGLPWVKKTKLGHWVNVGVLGRPAHEGLKRVFYASASLVNGELSFELHPMEYDHTEVVAAMRSEGLPEEFVQSLLIGEWTTCAAILPTSERAVKKKF
ncbi:metallophosphoesterase [Bacteriovorax stolpii]|uniref:Metallophosphoesterase n=1 Tax=Bacteriovorax stolpii TaxID=960 RepID=A0A2K9NUC5_BACTC|nr:metallophosphoesterase family protein [Bacteriovorax stolpii]AUN99119.1 metallophosphoesterase [Bacteriovorax stolpii]QDK40900.1 metallophosphoesterase [Bacteriovorax stolpii]TDP55349.1 putative phosphodiesterase [Bacteriovorax stolpii]